MLQMYIRSYDEHFDTFAIVLYDDSKQESLIPAALLPYLAPDLCAMSENLPYDAVGSTSFLQLPKSLFSAA